MDITLYHRADTLYGIPLRLFVFLSFTDYDLMSPPVFNGIENYRYMFTEDTLFWKSMGVTFAYVFLTIPLKLAFALGIAFVLNFKLRGIGFFRTAYYIPSILGSSVAIAVLWRALFAIDGLLNSFIGVFGFDPVNWLGEPSLALMSVTLLRVWQFGSAMVIFWPRCKTSRSPSMKRR